MQVIILFAFRTCVERSVVQTSKGIKSTVSPKFTSVRTILALLILLWIMRIKKFLDKKRYGIKVEKRNRLGVARADVLLFNLGSSLTVHWL